jgi:hypothetical protein
MRTDTLGWIVMLALIILYVAGFALGWAGTASWHLLIVVAAILLIYNALSRRGR